MKTPPKIYSIELCGLDGYLVQIEADKRRNLPAFVIVGLPDPAVKEARERVHSAIKNSGFPFPRGKTIVNLAPADLKKAGPRYDLPIAIGIIALFDVIPTEELENTIIIGELALDGSVRPINGILSTVEFAKKKGFKKIIVPAKNAGEAALISDIAIIPVRTLKEAIQHLSGELCPIPPTRSIVADRCQIEVDMANIKGQAQAKRALEIAAAGGHNLLFNGAPGAGKTLMAKALPGILPTMTEEEMLEVTKIYSICGLLPGSQPLITKRPFRSIHQTASAVSIVGGGNMPMPGEISLAHRGVLFMDEIAEFPKVVLEVLRQPMENQIITISRARGSLTYPAQFILIAAMNPCPCGYLNSEKTDKICTCSAYQIQNYHKRLSGPLLDRIDIHLNISPVKHDELTNDTKAESSEVIQKRIQKAADIQKRRLQYTTYTKNGEMDSEWTKKYCVPNVEGLQLLKCAIQEMGLSARGYYRILKLARTIADLEEKENIETAHIAEALQYRNKTT